MLHTPIRRWWAPWRRRCSCGVPWYPCPDTGRVPDAPLGDGSRPAWDGPTQALALQRQTPLLTLGQDWMTRQVGRW